VAIRKREQVDSFSGEGIVTIRPFKIGPDGSKIYSSVTKHNMIVELGRSSLIDLMIGEEKKKLTYIRWGKGGALQFPDGDPLNPLMVDDKDTDVATFLLDKPLNPYNRISPTEVEYVETLICDEVDDDVNEAAMLFEVEGSLERTIFSRITFPTVRLTIDQGTGIEIRWVFNFSKAEEVPVEYEETPIPVEPDTTPPADVTNLAETHTVDSITLTWTQPQDNDFAYVDIYRDGELAMGQVAESSWTDTGLVAGTYTYEVRAVDTVGNESAGASITVTI
jgi:hypothetical protein